jgi:hypothetical protein
MSSVPDVNRASATLKLLGSGAWRGTEALE